MTRAFICGCSGTMLNHAERSFLREAEPFGLILFKRNIESPAQVRALVDDARSLGGATAILVDQEGGRVQRLGPPHWRAGIRRRRGLGVESPDRRSRGFGFSSGADHGIGWSRRLGITFDCLPGLDVPVVGSHASWRSCLWNDPRRAAQLGRAAAEGRIAGRRASGHETLPGHGRAAVDSHLELPRVEAPLKSLCAPISCRLSKMPIFPRR